MPISRNQAFVGLAILTGVTFAIMGILSAPGNAMAITAVVVGGLYTLLAIFWKETSDPA